MFWLEDIGIRAVGSARSKNKRESGTTKFKALSRLRSFWSGPRTCGFCWPKMLAGSGDEIEVKKGFICLSKEVKQHSYIHKNKIQTLAESYIITSRSIST